MPIRFACPHCHQKLSVSSRKAGTSADCPRCKQKLSIPTPPPEPPKPAATSTPAPPPAPAAKPAAQPFKFPEPEASPASAPEAAVAVAEPPPEAEDAVWTPDPVGFEGMELVYDTTDSTSAAAAPLIGSEHTELVAIPRYVLYLQGGLIGVVALVAFAIGLLAGGAIFTQPPAPAEPEPVVLRGSVTYAAGPRNLPDEGAVIAIIPQSQSKPDDKAPVAGLRPDDPTPGESHRGIAVLRGLGGGYARADANGRFEVRLPDRGRYMVLVVSSGAQVRSIEDIQTGDILKLGPYFDNAADLLGDHRYKLTLETLRGDRDFNVAFE
ncbi:MAG TPA: hypothetical protein VFV87_10065 [Pirellulaceae bacterium]|nr:hypothetical protein [Pirellulaceae bacterium]